MPVKIRLARRGRKKMAMYDVVVADSRAPRDGRFIEKIGTYNPNTDPASINLDADKAFDWVMKGAQSTDTVRAMLSYRGVMYRKHLQIGVEKGAISQEDADEKLAVWIKNKESKIQGKIDKLTNDKVAKIKAKLEVESKVKEARYEALKKKAQEAEVALLEDIKEAGIEGDESLADDVAGVEEMQQAEAKEVKTKKTPSVKEKTKAEISPEKKESKTERIPAKGEKKKEKPKSETSKNKL